MRSFQVAFVFLTIWAIPAFSGSCEDLFRTAEREQRNVVTVPSAGCDLTTPLLMTTSGFTVVGETPAAEIRLTAPPAGLRIVNARNVSIRDLSIVSAEWDGSTGDSVAVTGNSGGFAIERVKFVGGGAHINLNGTGDFVISETKHVGPRRNGMVIYCNHCTRGIIHRPVIEGYVVPTGGPFRAIDLVESEHVSVFEPEIRDIDASSQANFAGIEYVDSHDGSITGGRISGLINGDGIFIGRSTGITISSVKVENNSGHPRSIPGGGSGSGIDVFGSGDITITGSTVRHNGHSPTPASRHHALEIYESDGVRIIDTTADDSGKNGVLLYGSPRVLLVGVSAVGNQESGLNAMKASARADISGDQLTVPSGDSFGRQWQSGTLIHLGDRTHRIASVTDNEHLTLTEHLPARKRVAWSVQTSLAVIDGRFEGNGLGRRGNGYQDGLTITDATQAVIIGTKAPVTKGGAQKYGLRSYSDALVLSLP